MLLPRDIETHAGFARPWPAVLVTWGPGARSDRHAHHCWHLLVALDGALVVTAASEAVPARAVLTPPDVPHAIDADGAVVLVFVDPESALGDRLAGVYGRSDVTVFPDATAELLRDVLSAARSSAAAEAALERAMATLGAEVRRPRALHPGVRRVIRHLHDAPPDADASLDALAALARLSPGRFMHAFTESVGLPLRPYLRWLRVERAALALARGVPPSEAAVEAGFADGPHMTRTFRELFGVTPSDLRRRSQSVQDARGG